MYPCARCNKCFKVRWRILHRGFYSLWTSLFFQFVGKSSFKLSTVVSFVERYVYGEGEEVVSSKWKRPESKSIFVGKMSELFFQFREKVTTLRMEAITSFMALG